MNKRFVIVIFHVVLFSGIGLGLFLSNSVFPKQKAPGVSAVRQKGFTYIAPLLKCETSIENNESDLKELKSKLSGYIDQSQLSNQARNVSVYFREPNKGNWIVINETDKYTPASLLKVPLLIAYYKQADNDQTILARKIEFKDDGSNNYENIKATNELQPGKSYTIDELVRQMIVESDNESNNLLMKNINEIEFDNVFEEIGVGKLDYSKTDDFMTVKNYANFFRILYNSTYLSRNMSEKALKLLSQTKYTQGVAAGLPKEVQIAHKFGERGYDFSGIKQLHDCGIVYYPNDPYILCIMTRGDSFENLQNVIQHISGITYEEVKKLNDSNKAEN